jgi:broad specificity phosphatase PhoE
MGAILAILFSFSALPTAQAQEVIYLIRHAEKVKDVEDPPLTEAGLQRARAWAEILRDTGITAVYTSKKQRTQQTGAPIARALSVPLRTVSRKDVAGLVDRLRTRHAGEAVLIVGHTKTIPKLVKELGKSDNGTIERSDFDNLFVIVPEGKNDATVMRLRAETGVLGPNS